MDCRIYYVGRSIAQSSLWAEAATLGDLVRAVETKKTVPPWFWLFVSAAALILFWAVARALRQEPAP